MRQLFIDIPTFHKHLLSYAAATVVALVCGLSFAEPDIDPLVGRGILAGMAAFGAIAFYAVLAIRGFPITDKGVLGKWVYEAYLKWAGWVMRLVVTTGRFVMLAPMEALAMSAAICTTWTLSPSTANAITFSLIPVFIIIHLAFAWPLISMKNPAVKVHKAT